MQKRNKYDLAGDRLYEKGLIIAMCLFGLDAVFVHISHLNWGF